MAKKPKDIKPKATPKEEKVSVIAPEINSLKDTLKKLAKNEARDRELNKKMFTIYEGDLLCQLEEKLKGIFSPATFDELRKFLVPINVLPKVIDKLTKIYQQEPTRDVSGGNESDKELLTWYTEAFCMNDTMNTANEFFNLSKSVLIEPYLDEGEPQLRVIPKDKFFVYSNDSVNPLKPTHISIILFQKTIIGESEPVNVYLTWSKDEMLIWDDKFQNYPGLMAEYGMPDGVNQYGAIPYIYINRSKNRLTPITDNDTLCMVLELPSQLSWLNMAVGYNCFPINYVIDASSEDLKRAPNVLWRLSSNLKTEKQPVVGTIKPEVDIVEALQFIQSSFGMWLNTKGLRPGAVGELTPETMASGISKMVDESDTTEARKAQVSIFKRAEKMLFKLLFENMHPYWVKTGQVENRAIMSTEAKVLTNFAEQKPVYTRSEIITNVKDELALKLETRKGAMKRLNPHMTDEQVEEKLVEIDEESAKAVEDAQKAMANGQMPKPGEENKDGQKPPVEDDEQKDENDEK